MLTPSPESKMASIHVIGRVVGRRIAFDLDDGDSRGKRKERHMADGDNTVDSSSPAESSTPDQEFGKQRITRRRALTLGAVAAGALGLGSAQIAGAVPVSPADASTLVA